MHLVQLIGASGFWRPGARLAPSARRLRARTRGDDSLDTTHLIALAAALGWASGIRLYAVVLVRAVGWLGWVALPSGLQVLQHPLVLGASA